MNIKLFALCLLVSLAGISCNKGKTATATNGQGNDDTVVVELKYASVDDIPAELLTEAVEYFGLLNDAERTYKYWKTAGDEPDIGWERVTFLPSEDGNPQFEFRRRGALLDLTDETVELREDGIYGIKTGLGSQKAAWLQIPSNVEVGSTWQDELDMHHTRTNQDIVQSMVFKAARIESITVEAGTYSTLVVEVEATLSTQSEPQTMTIRYAKGVGVVLLELSGVTPDGKPVKHRIELIDDGSKNATAEEAEE